MKEIIQSLKSNNDSTRDDIEVALQKMEKENKMIDQKAIEISALRTVVGTKRDSLLSSDENLENDQKRKRVATRHVTIYSVLCIVMFLMMAGLLYCLANKSS